MQRGRGCGPWGRACPFPLPPPCLLPPAGLGRPQPTSASLDLLGPFVLRMAGSVFGPVNFLSFAVPQFKLVTHKSSLRLSSGHSVLVPTLSNAARSSLFRPHLLVADAGVWDTFLLGVAFRHVICGFYLLFPSQSGCPPRFKNFPQICQCKTPFLGQISILSSFVSFFIFYVLSYLLSKTMGCFSGCLMTSASNQKLFCEVCSVFSYSFDEFVGEKVVYPSYSSTILASPFIRAFKGVSAL